MRTRVLVLLIALSMIGSSLVIAIGAKAGGSETGQFPDRTFTVSKGILGKPDKAEYTTSITPTIDCTWWVELVSLGGSSVKVDVYQWTPPSLTSVSHSKVSQVGAESDHVALQNGLYYLAIFTYLGKAGTSTLAERAVSESSGNMTHAPIIISSNADFTSANGVVSGSGSASDPYIIGGWNITAGSASCIYISNTTASFEIRDVRLNSFSGETGVRCSNVVNGKVVNSSTAGCWNGVQLEQCSNFDVLACNFSDAITGVRATDSSMIEVRASSMSDTGEGLDFLNCYDFRVVDCTVVATWSVCWMDQSTRETFIGNSMTLQDARGIGFYILDSTVITLYSNKLEGTSIDMTAIGGSYTGFTTHTIPANNTANGKPILYQLDATGLALDRADYGEIILAQCHDVTVSNMTFAKDYAAVILAYTDGAIVRDNSFDLCGIGVRVWGCTDVQIRSNIVTEATFQGIGLWMTDGAVVQNNSMSSTGIPMYQTLMPIYHCSWLEVTDNTLTDSWEGMVVFDVTSSNVAGNSISNMEYHGITIGYSGDTTVKENVLAHNQLGIELSAGSGVKIYHNNFVSNAAQASTDGAAGNSWDDGYPDGGNYWSDYTGKDFDRDGIGDSPYMIPTGGVDNYPLMAPY